MATKIEDVQSRFVEIERVAELRWKDGNDIVVAVRDCGYGPAVDLREYVTRDAYTDADFRVVGGSIRKPRVQREPYIGPTKRGFWLSADMASAIADALALASIRATIERGDDA